MEEPNFTSISDVYQTLDKLDPKQLQMLGSALVSSTNYFVDMSRQYSPEQLQLMINNNTELINLFKQPSFKQNVKLLLNNLTPQDSQTLCQNITLLSPYISKIQLLLNEVESVIDIMNVVITGVNQKCNSSVVYLNNTQGSAQVPLIKSPTKKLKCDVYMWQVLFFITLVCLFVALFFLFKK